MRRHIERYTPLILAAALLAVLAGCRPALNPFTAGDYIGGTATAAATVETALSDAQLDAYQDKLADPKNDWPLTVGAIAAPLAALAGQRITIPFTNGVIDEDTIAGGILLYALGTPANADGSYPRGTALTLTVLQIAPDGTGGCTLRLSVDLSGSSVSTTIELWIKADILTANGGTNRLDLDGDDVYGEAGEDDYYNYPTVTGATVTPAGNPRSPRAIVNASAPGGFAVGEPTMASTITNSTGATTALTTASVGDGWTWAKFSPTAGTWGTVTPGDNYDTGVLTWTFTTDFARGDLYRVTADRYTITESETVRGYVHRVGYNSTDPDRRYWYGYSGAVRTSVLVDDAADGANAYGTKDLTGGPGVDWSVTNQTFNISTDGAAAVTVTLATAETTLGGVVGAVDTALPAGYNAVASDYNLDGTNESITITRTATGSNTYFILTAGSPDALATLGLSPGTYIGSDAWDGDPTGVKPSDESESDYARWIELNFEAPVDTTTITPTSVVIVDDSAGGMAVTWEAAGLVAVTDRVVRISLPSTFKGDGDYYVRIYPTVLGADGVPFADTSYSGDRSTIGGRADYPYFESNKLYWN